MNKLAFAACIAALCLHAQTNDLNPRTLASGSTIGGVTIGTLINVSTGCGLSGGPITASGTLAANQSVNAQTGASYTFVNGDCGKLVTQSNAGAVAHTLPQAGSGGNFINGWFVDVQNTGAGTVTITPTTSTIDGAASLALTTNQGVRIFSNGVNYFTQRGVGGAGGTNLSNVGGGVVNIYNGTPNQVKTLTAGSGITLTDAANLITPAIDSAVVPTKANLQSATNPQICTSASASGTAYTATCATTLSAYATKQTLFWYTDVTNTSTTPTLNLDTLGIKTLVKQDGTALAVNDIKATALYRIWYDGTNIRVVEAGLGGTTIAATNDLTHGWTAVGGTNWLNNFNYNSQAYTLNVVNYMQMYTAQPMAIGTGTSYVGTAAAASYVGTAIYDANCNLLAGSNGADASTTGVKTTTFTRQTIAANSYFYVAWVPSSTSILWGKLDGTTHTQLAPNATNFTGANAASFSGSTITWPATCGAKTITNDYPLPFLILSY